MLTNSGGSDAHISLGKFVTEENLINRGKKNEKKTHCMYLKCTFKLNITSVITHV